MIIQNQHGLSIGFLDNGSIKSIEADPIRISLKAVTPYSKPGTNLFLRKRETPYEHIALLGPGSNSHFKLAGDAFIAKGSWDGLDYTCVLQLSKKSRSWQWSIDISSSTAEAVELDVIYVQDVGLKPISAGLINEYYVSQYLERLVLEDQKYGSVICCRQNMKEPVGNPWLMVACKNSALSGSVDGMQFYGKTYRKTGVPEGLLVNALGGNYAGESSVLSLQEKPFILAPGHQHQSVFMVTYLPDHPSATSPDDLHALTRLFDEFGEKVLSAGPEMHFSEGKNIFHSSTFMPVDDLTDRDIDLFFSKERRHCEEENGQLLSFFYDRNTHVMLRAKEILADRPHGHIMQAKAGFVPNEDIVSTNAFAFGVFNSHLTQGNTNFNILLSVCSSQFNLATETGQRIFVKMDGRYYLLGVPSAFEIGLNCCRWIYKYGNCCFQVRTWTSKQAPQVNLDFKVIWGNPTDLLITHDFDEANGWKIFPGDKSGEFVAKPKAGSTIVGKFPNARFRMIVQSENAKYKACGDEVLYPGYRCRENSLFVLDVRETSGFCMSFIGEVRKVEKGIEIENPDNQWLIDCRDARSAWQELSLNLSLKGEQKDIATIREILPWYGMNALTHFLTPYGLEQFSGAAWGTRDVSQGPIDLLLFMEKFAEAKEVLRILFSNQHPDGGWPQWWMFDSYSNIRAHDAHGDVVYWCIIALANYIKVTGDIKILDEILPFYNQNESTCIEKEPISKHIERLIKLIVDSFIPGTSLVPFGGGDWNDSLQPVSKELAQRMISSWTVEMNYQAFKQYELVYKLSGNMQKAIELKDICNRIKTDFNKYLVKDGVLAGYGLVEEDRSISLLLHPSDTKTGIHYSILPMNRGIISGIFSKEQALHHQQLIDRHLKGPDGARLMDRPLKYNGGIQTIFQRAESSTYFGREIGLMYVHEHIRYAEAQAIMGNAVAFIHALRQANPVAYREIVACADIRQSNCYYSSSDVAFKSRYEADERYDEIKLGNLPLKGGWRVYSSGPGIYIGLIVSRLLGLRVEYGNVIIDPVMPYSLNGFSAHMEFLGHPFTLVYKITERNYSPGSVFINRKAVRFDYEDNMYRQGGAVVSMDAFVSLLNENENILEITL